MLYPDKAITCPTRKPHTVDMNPQNQNLNLMNMRSAEWALCKSYARVDSSIPISSWSSIVSLFSHQEGRVYHVLINILCRSLYLWSESEFLILAHGLTDPLAVLFVLGLPSPICVDASL